ncbi:hypothetical protein G5714_002692 [Onychostoma macrolepis]|uniref:non-specific serine/threonine protein kinase n=1 Tax=Onychostoma macrolepis TaxID=369639 RepID=A0A7J6D7G2_9TELE|nr:hypothetical protein G5714_002692 [Onychostoma macrolepis]
MLIKLYYPSTQRLYAFKWSVFSDWCSARNQDPVSCDVSHVLTFLQELLDKGHTPSTLKIYVAAIAANHSLEAGRTIGRNALVIKFLRGARQLNPSRPKTMPTWALFIVLGPLRKQLIALENRLKAEMDEHKLRLQKEVETQANDTYIELERLTKMQAAQLDKEVCAPTLHFVDRVMKSSQDVTFLSANSDTPKEEKQERSSRHKETTQRSQAEEEAQLLNQQRLVYERSCRALKRRSLIKKHEFEQEQMRELEQRQLQTLQRLRFELMHHQHQTELENQKEYNSRHRKHALQRRQQARNLKTLEMQIKKQFQDTCKVQNKQYKALRNHQLEVSPKKQYEQSINEMMASQSLRLDEEHEAECQALRQQLHQEMELLDADQNKTKAQMEAQHEREVQKLEQKASLRRAHLEQKKSWSHFMRNKLKKIKHLFKHQEQELEMFDIESAHLGSGSLASFDFPKDEAR